MNALSLRNEIHKCLSSEEVISRDGIKDMIRVGMAKTHTLFHLCITLAIKHSLPYNIDLFKKPFVI